MEYAVDEGTEYESVEDKVDAVNDDDVLYEKEEVENDSYDVSNEADEAYEAYSDVVESVQNQEQFVNNEEKEDSYEKNDMGSAEIDATVEKQVNEVISDMKSKGKEEEEWEEMDYDVEQHLFFTEEKTEECRLAEAGRRWRGIH